MTRAILVAAALALPTVAAAACDWTPGPSAPLDFVRCLADHVADFVPGDVSALAARLTAVEDAPLTKDDLYVITAHTPALVGFTNLDAACLDANDILLTGGCKTFSDDGLWYDNYPTHAADPAEPAVWNCGLKSNDDRELDMSAYAVCIAVP